MSTTPSRVFLDTSSLMRQADADVSAPSPRNQGAGAAVDQLLADADRELALSEITLLEFVNAVAADWRDGQHPEFDADWAQRRTLQLMELIAARRIDVRSLPPGAMEHALALVTVATRDYNNGLRVWDALHLITAAAWSRELGEPVQLYTSDDDFQAFVDRFPEFAHFVQIVNINP